MNDKSVIAAQSAPVSFRIERRGTDAAPWTIVHTATGLTVPVLRPYPGQETWLPPIYVANHATRDAAEAAAQEFDWARIDEMAKDPAVLEQAARAAEKRESDAAYSRALKGARAGTEPWPWEPGGLLHREKIVELQPPIQTTLDLAA